MSQGNYFQPGQTGAQPPAYPPPPGGPAALRGITRGDAVVILAVVLVFIFSFFHYYEVSVSDESSSSRTNPFGGARTETGGANAWAVDFYPLMPAVVMFPVVGMLLGLIGRFSAQPQRQFLGLTLRQWWIAFGVTGAVNGFFAVFGVGAAVGEVAEAMFGSSADSGVTAFGYLIMAAGLVQGLFLLITDRVPALALPLTSSGGTRHGEQWQHMPPPPPQQPSGMYPAQPSQPAYGASGQMPQQQGVLQQPVQPPVGMPAPGPVSPPAASPDSGSAPAVDISKKGFTQFWFAVPEPRALTPADGSAGPSPALLKVGDWYLALEQRGGGLLVDVDGVRGVLEDLDGIQRGE